MENKPSVVMMGLGYIGLPTAALIASRGLKVTGVDIHQSVVDTINKGEIHIIEPEMEGIVHKVDKEGFLQASNTLSSVEYLLLNIGLLPDFLICWNPFALAFSIA